MPPLLHEVAHLAHAELRTPEPERSLWFFTQVLGMSENGAAGDSVYLRTWDDYEHHSLKLTGAATSGIGRTGLRAASAEALRRRVAAIEAASLGLGWQDGDLGLGPTYLFRDPDGHEFELYYETERYRPSGADQPALKNQAQAYPDRIELCNPCARLIFAPDWAPVSWTQAERARGQAWGLATIPSFHTHGTPPLAEAPDRE
jgi:catechol 2,3-dioxygenase